MLSTRVCALKIWWRCCSQPLIQWTLCMLSASVLVSVRQTRSDCKDRVIDRHFYVHLANILVISEKFQNDFCLQVRIPESKPWKGAQSCLISLAVIIWETRRTRLRHEPGSAPPISISKFSLTQSRSNAVSSIFELHEESTMRTGLRFRWSCLPLIMLMIMTSPASADVVTSSDKILNLASQEGSLLSVLKDYISEEYDNLRDLSA